MALAAAKRCTSCRRRISGRFIESDKGAFCSNRCYSKTLPPCDTCGKRLTGRYLTLEDKKFCSQKCYESVLPRCELCERPVNAHSRIDGHVFCQRCASGSRCAECMLPFRRGLRFADGRAVCQDCGKSAVADAAEAAKLYVHAQRDHFRITKLKSAAAPKLKLVDRTQLRELMGFGPNPPSHGMVARGYYRRSESQFVTKNFLGRVIEEKKTVVKTIFALHGMRRDNFLATVVHELTHDMIAEQFPAVGETPLWVQEGVCQYVAATYCRQSKFADTLRQLEESPDPTYGDGYRYFKRTFGDNNYSGLLRWLRSTAPARAPAQPPKK